MNIGEPLCSIIVEPLAMDPHGTSVREFAKG